MNLLRTGIVAVVVCAALAPVANADPWFAERPSDAPSAAVIAGDRPAEAARIQAPAPISGDRPREVARIQAPAPISGDRPADRAPTSLVIPVVSTGGESFDWVAAGVGAASAFALVGVVFGSLAVAGRRRRVASAA